MKQYIILIVALVMVIGLNIYQNMYLNKTGETLLNKIEVVEQNLESKKFENAYNEILKLEKEWKSKKNTWDIFTEHDDVEAFESHIASLKAFTKAEDYSESLNAVLVVKQRIKHILENESLSFATIF